MISTVLDIRAAVSRFGQAVRREHPGGSFQVFVDVSRGNRKPNGFGCTRDTNGFGQDDFMATRDSTS